MSAADKTLKVVVTVDEQTVRRSMDLVKRLTNEAKKSVEEVSKAQNLLVGGQGSNGGGTLSARSGATPQNVGGTQPGGMGQRLTQGLAQQKSIISGLGNASKDVLRAMNEEFRKSIAFQKQQLEIEGKAVDDLAKKYHALAKQADLQGARGHTALSGVMRNGATRAYDQMISAVETLQARKASVAETESGIAQVKTLLSGGGGGGGPPNANTGSGSHKPDKEEPQSTKARMSAADAALIGSYIGRALGGVVANIGSFGQSQKLIGESNAASIQQSTYGRFLNGMRSGDVRDFYFMNKMKGIDGTRIGDNMLDEGKWSGPGFAKAQLVGQGIEGASNVVGGVVGIASGIGAARAAVGSKLVRSAKDIEGSVGGVVGGSMNVARAISSYNNGGPEAIDVATRMEGLSLAQQASPVTNAAFDTLNEEKHIRASSSRHLMGRHLQARGIGAGYGYGFGEAVGLAESMQRRVGMQGMFGSGGKTRVARTGAPLGQVGEVYGILPGAGSIGTNTNNKLLNQMVAGQNDLTNNGLMKTLDGKLMQIPDTQASGITTKRAGGSRGLFESMAQMAGHGIDVGQAGTSLASVFSATGGLNKNAQNPERTMKVFEEALARGVNKGFSDPRTKEELVAAIGQGASGAILSSTEGLQRLSAFVTAGGHGQVTVAEAEARRGVLSGLDNLGANNGYFQGINTAIAKNVMGPGQSPLQLMAGSGATASQLLTGGQMFDDLGISEGQRMAMFKDRIKGVMGTYASMDTSGEFNSALGKAGGDMTKMDPKFIRRILRQTKTFGNDEAASAAADMFTNLDEVMNLAPGAKNAKLKQYTDGLAIAAISMEERTKAELIGKEVGKAMSEIYKKVDVTEIVKEMQKAEQEGKNYDFQAGRMFVVQIVKALDAQKTLPQKPR